MRYLAVVEYDGTNYVGWQVQPNGVSVEEEIEKALSKIFNSPIKIYGSGRTDAGVHALGQTFHFDSKEIIDSQKFLHSLNSLLPSDIQVLSLETKDADFSARFSAKGKTYRYVLNCGNYDVFHRHFVSQHSTKLDVEKMKEAATLFVGEHNFQNFTSKEDDDANFVRNVTNFDLKAENEIITFTISGNGFMRYMVRMIVGTLIEVGLHKLSLEEVQSLLDSKKRKIVSYKADANGLFLQKVDY